MKQRELMQLPDPRLSRNPWQASQTGDQIARATTQIPEREALLDLYKHESGRQPSSESRCFLAAMIQTEHEVSPHYLTSKRPDRRDKHE
jgi:hypothetical protein